MNYGLRETGATLHHLLDFLAPTRDQRAFKRDLALASLLGHLVYKLLLLSELIRRTFIYVNSAPARVSRVAVFSIFSAILEKTFHTHRSVD